MRKAAGLAALVLLAGCGPGQDPATGADVLALTARIAAGDAAALPDLKRLADAKRLDAAAAMSVALMEGPAPEPQMACAYAQRAARQYSAAMRIVAGCLNADANADRRQLKAAAALYREAAARGDAKAKCAYGRMMMEGRGAGPNPIKAAALCEEAAAAGDVEAMATTGNFYLLGLGVERNPVKARDYFGKAAEKGDANAAFRLGQLYWNGDGVAENNAEAARWWRVAFAEGRLDAAKLLGDEAALRAEAGQAIDPAAAQEAIAWYDRALAAGLKEDIAAEVRGHIADLKAGRPRQ